MSRNGSGTYSLPAGNPIAFQATSNSATMNTTLSDVATALTGSLAANGETPVTANIPMAGFKLTGLGAAASNGDAVRYESMGGFLQAQLFTAFTTGGTSTAFTLTPVPAIAANTTNQRFRVKFNAASGATPTLAVSGQTAKSLKYYDYSGSKQAITSTQVPINWESDIEYDGTDWVVMNICGAVGIVEGTFTPGLSFGGGTTGITYAEQVGSYTKIGNRVLCTGKVALSNKGSSTGAALITGLPLTVANSNDAIAPITLRLFGLTYSGVPQAYTTPNSTTIVIEEYTEAGVANALTNTAFINTTSVIFSFAYRV